MERSELNYNPIYIRNIEMKEKVSCLQKKKLELLPVVNPKNYQLKAIKRSKLKPKTGDVFVIQPVEGVYFYGKVLVGSVDYIDKKSDYNGASVIVIFKSKTKEFSLDEYSVNYDNLLLLPTYVTNLYWIKGYFYTIGNIELTKQELNLDYGFFRNFSFQPGGYFVNVKGEDLRVKPKMFNIKGIKTDIGIAMQIWKNFIVEPELLDNKYDFTEKGIVKLDCNL